jgi:uncharacterized protein (TIGR03437 family)
MSGGAFRVVKTLVIASRTTRKFQGCENRFLRRYIRQAFERRPMRRMSEGMRNQLQTVAAIIVLASAVPVVALADISGTVTLMANTALNLDTGTTSSSGADILWNGSSLTPQGGAGAFNLGAAGSVIFSTLTLPTLQALPLSAYTKASISATSLIVNDIFFVYTNGTNYAKVLVTAVAGTSITLQFDTFESGSSGTGGTGNTGGSTGPTVTTILNNYSLIQPGLPNYGIAPSALFIVTGTGLADPTAQAAPLQSSVAPGIPLTLNGASIAVTVNGVTVHPGIYYATATQIAAVLPAGTPAGTGTLTVTYNNTPSAAVPMTIVPAALGIGTYNGLAIATNPTTGALYTYTNSAKPGDTIVLWGSGLGGIPADSDTVFTSTPHAASVPTQIYIGGIQATVLYAGDSGYPGVNQIDVTIPPSVMPGCYVSLVAVSGTGSSLVVSNTTAISIADTEAGVCSDPILGINGATISALSGQATVRTGGLGLTYHSDGNGVPTATFEAVPGSYYAANPAFASLGGCTFVAASLTSSTSNAAAPGPITNLDAGLIQVTGPAGSVTISTTPGVASSTIPAGFIPPTGGTFTFSGTGGRDVGAFNVSFDYPPQMLAFSWTNAAANATVTRSQGETFTWTGGPPNSYVFIVGFSPVALAQQYTTFYCFAPVSAGQFTVPPSILLGMLPGAGDIEVANYAFLQSFNAPGIDLGATGASWTLGFPTTFK